MNKTRFKVPTEYQRENIAADIKDELLPSWQIDDIADGIKRICVNGIGNISEVYLSSGLFARVCYAQYGDRRRKRFTLNGLVVKQWRSKA